MACASLDSTKESLEKIGQQPNNKGNALIMVEYLEYTFPPGGGLKGKSPVPERRENKT
jgi:hypothetical protein